MWVHEYQVKELLRQYDVPVLPGIAVFSIQEAIEAAQKIGGQCWSIKVQTHSKKTRLDKKVVCSLEALKSEVIQFLDTSLDDLEHEGAEKKIRRLLIEEHADVRKTYLLSMSVDYDQGARVVSFKHAGASDRQNFEVDVFQGISIESLQEMLDAEQVLEHEAAQMTEIGRQLDAFYQATDATFLCVSLGWIELRERVEVLEVRACFDDHALFRQPQISVLRDLDEEPPRVLEASLYNIDYKDFSRGNHVGCLTNGVGVCALLLDEFNEIGVEPACVSSIEGILTEERVMAALEIMQKNEKVDVVLISMISDVVSCHVMALFMVRACQILNFEKPLVMRLKGAGEEMAMQALKASGLKIYEADDLVDGVQKAIALGG